MGKDVFTRSLYTASLESKGLVSDYASDGTAIAAKAVTRKAEQKAYDTGKLEPLVDPSGFGVIRLSLPRVEKRDDGKYELLVGCPMPIENRVDTTGSMGGNVDIAMRVLPDAFEYCRSVLEGYDIQVATGIFGDVCDRFPLCRPQFEMDADKIISQLTMMVPERRGGDPAEDPDYGIFGGAYFCRHYINRIGLKGYDFTVTDAPGRGRVAEDQLERVFGDKFRDKLKENGFEFKVRGSMETGSIFEDLLDRAHAFVLQVGRDPETRDFWHDIAGANRVIEIPDTHYLPQVEAAIIGVTEGTLIPSEVPEFLTKANMPERDADSVAEVIGQIPVAEQAGTEAYENCPVRGDLFDGKPDVWEDTNLWPTGQAEEVEGEEDEEEEWV